MKQRFYTSLILGLAAVSMPACVAGEDATADALTPDEDATANALTPDEDAIADEATASAASAASAVSAIPARKKVTVVIRNKMNVRLELVSHTAAPYVIEPPGVPNIIEAHTEQSWSALSAPGAPYPATVGTATYKIRGGNHRFTFSWNKPYTGASSYGAIAPRGFTTSYTSTGGNNATVYFTVTKP